MGADNCRSAAVGGWHVHVTMHAAVYFAIRDPNKSQSTFQFLPLKLTSLRAINNPLLARNDRPVSGRSEMSVAPHFADGTEILFRSTTTAVWWVNSRGRRWYCPPIPSGDFL